MTEFNIRDHFKSISVLDHGSVELTDGMSIEPMRKIVKSARVSFLRDEMEFTDKDVALVKYLLKHEHFSTFRHSYFTFRVKAPLFVFRQWWKYQIGSNWEERDEPEVNSIIIPETNWNEQSLRYTEAKQEFYIPNTIRIQSKTNKQGSDGELLSLKNGEDPVAYFKQACERQFADYIYMVESGGAKEQCRALLPTGLYTSCYWTCSLQTVLFFLSQRLKPESQSEIREYALGIKELMAPLIGSLDD